MFLGIMPQMSEIITDHGVSDFNSNFTALCEMMGIEHSGSTPRRSQSNGVTEIGNKLLQQQLGRICASTEGRKMWDVSLPKCIQALNQFYPYKSKLSRVQLLFSPFYFCATGGIMGLANPIKFQKFNFKTLNDHRIRNLLNQRISDKRYEFKINQFVTMENQPPKGEKEDIVDSINTLEAEDKSETQTLESDSKKRKIELPSLILEKSIEDLL